MKICGCRREWMYSGSSKVRGVVVHGGDQPELRVRLDLDAGDDGLHVAAVIEQRRQAGPALLAHAVAFVEDGDAAADHGGDQRGSDIAQAAFALDHGRDQQVFRARIHGGLQDVDLAPHAACAAA